MPLRSFSRGGFHETWAAVELRGDAFTSWHWPGTKHLRKESNIKKNSSHTSFIQYIKDENSLKKSYFIEIWSLRRAKLKQLGNSIIIMMFLSFILLIRHIFVYFATSEDILSAIIKPRLLLLFGYTLISKYISIEILLNQN